MKTTKQLLALIILAFVSSNIYAQESGTLIVLKDKTIFWGKKDMPLTINGKDVGTLPSNTKLEFELRPGSYTLKSLAPFLSDETTITINAGETTYIKSITTPNLADPTALNTTLPVVSESVGKPLFGRFTDGTVTIDGAGSITTLAPGAAQTAVATAEAPAEAATTETTNADGSEKTEEQLKKEAVDGFISGLGDVDIKEIIANNKRQKEMVAIGDLYDFSNVAEGDAPMERESTYSVLDVEAPPKLEKEFPNLKYRRSSVYTLIINDTTRAGYPFILSAFGDAELPEKFNNHNVGEYLIEGDGGVRKEEEQAAYITEYLNNNHVGKKLVAKWFNRSAKGGFNMDLISRRGYYNATELDVALAQSSQRGLALLGDAGEELLQNTFILVNDYNFTNKEEVAQKVNTGLGFAAALAKAAGEDDLAKSLNNVSKVVDFVGKGFVIRTRTYLYQLEWNDDIANQFYSQLWTTDANLDPSRVNAFNKSDLFKVKLVGYQAATADLQSTKATTKTDIQLIQEATLKAQDKAIAKLEKTYEQFRTKTPLFSVDPLSAKIGLKEDLSKGDKFEVLEQVLDNEGRTRYKRRAVIEVDHKKIWDNTYGANEDPDVDQSITATVFKGNSKGLYEGMLIRQIN